MGQNKSKGFTPEHGKDQDEDDEAKTAAASQSDPPPESPTEKFFFEDPSQKKRNPTPAEAAAAHKAAKAASDAQSSPEKQAKAAGGAMIEAVVCGEDDMKDGEMRVVNIGEGRVLLARDAGQFYAVGTSCSHYGAPLVKGSMSNGRVRCPWHGACFSLKTGDIEDFPGLDSIPKFEVEVSDGAVVVKAHPDAIGTKKRAKSMCKQNKSDSNTYLIIGGGAAAATCVETLRQEGFTGRVVMATKEKHRPYDRPKLSKALELSAESLALRSNEFYAEHNIEILTEKEAVSVDCGSKTVTFQDGETISYTKLMIATGGSPRSLGLPGSDLKNIFSLRTPEEGNTITKVARDKHLVIIGSSFIGLETAAFLADKVASVTVVGRSSVPLAQVLGEDIGVAVQKILEDKGVKFVFGKTPEKFEGEDGKLTQVILADGTTLQADVCVTGVGVVPSTDFLKDSGIDMTNRGYVNVNKKMETNQSDVYAAGDIVQFPLFMMEDEMVNVQHWQMAHMHGRIAGLNMAGKETEVKSVPFFWTTIGGKSIRYTGFGQGFDHVMIHGNLQELKFVAVFVKGDHVNAVASMSSDPIVSYAAELFQSGEVITRQQAEEDPSHWLKDVKAAADKT